MLTRKMKLAFAVSLVLILCGASFAQEREHNRRDQQGYRDRQNDRARSRSYRTPNRHQDGYYGNGQYGSYPNRPYGGYGNGTYRTSPYYGNGQYGGYPNGPNGGYGNGTYGTSPYYGNGQYGGYPNGPYGGHGNGTYGNGPYGSYGQYGNYGGNGQQVAYNNGYQEGLRYGQNDRGAGRRYTPTSSGVYSNADRGYNSSYGDKTSYRLTFRNGYVAGYDRGYNAGFGRRY